MKEAVDEFLEGLSGRKRRIQTLPEKLDAVIRLDLVANSRTDQWYIDLKDGWARAATENPKAPDCVFSADRELFNRFVTGQSRLIAAYFRNELRVEGDLRLMAMLERVLPPPPGAPTSAAEARKRR